ncbi:hypothetical protein Ancab_001893 [Ancistrocladus abbreviatus]
MLDISEEAEKQLNTPYRVYVRDSKATARTPANVKEYPNTYQFIINMPRTKSSEVKVQLEDENVLVNANIEAIKAVCRDGVLTVTVEKLPPPEPKKPKTIQVQVA